MTARKSDDNGKVTEPKAEDDIKASAKEGPVIELEAEDVTELNAKEDAVPEQGKADLDEQPDDGQDESEEAKATDVSDEQESAPSDIDHGNVPSHPAAAPVAEKKGGMGSGLIGGLLGGVVALGLGYGGLQQGLVSLPQDKAVSTEQAAQLDAVKSALAELQSKISEQASAPQMDVSDLEGRLAAAEGKLADLSSQFSKMNSIAAGGSDIGNAAPVATAEASTDHKVGNGAPAMAQASAEDVAKTEPVTVDLTPLQDRIGALATELAALTGRVDGFSALTDQISAAEGKLAELEQQANVFAGSVDTRLTETKLAVLASADRRIDNVVTDLTNMRSKIGEEAKALGERLTSLEDNNLSDKMQSSARTIALAGLENAVASGQAFSAALNTFGQVAVDNEAVQALKAHAEAGAPTVQALASQFRMLSGQLLKAAEEAGATSLVDKIMLNAQNLVRIRPIGEREGESLSDKLARIEVRVNDGRLGDIAKEWDGLPDAAKQAGQAWYDGVQARLAVDGSMDKIRAEFGKDAAQ